jgi:multiple sugar transport system ATP-binding protein
MTGLRVRDLTKSFGGNTVIDNISFEVSEGEFCILLGPSGCGKTTILRLIAGLEDKDSGEIFIDGREVSNLTPKERDVAMVFQSYALYPHMTVFENLAFPLRMKKIPKSDLESKVKAVAGLLGIDSLLTRKPKELSGGQRQRVAIGRAIVRDPRLFLFDEPLSNLDAKLRASMRVELAGLHHRLKATMIYVTHDQVEAMTLGDRIIVLEKGRIQQIGTPEEIYNRPSNLFVATFIGSPQINIFKGIITTEGEDSFFESTGFRVKIEDYKGLEEYSGREVLMGVRPESLTPGDGPVSGNIDIIENLGSESIIHVRSGDKSIVAKVSSDYKFRRGDRVSFLLKKRGIHYFYRGRRIGSGDDGL